MLIKILRPFCSAEVRMLLDKMELSPREVIDGHDGWHEFIFRSGDYYRKFKWVEQLAIDTAKDSAKSYIEKLDRQEAYKAITVKTVGGMGTDVARQETPKETINRLQQEINALHAKHRNEINQYELFIKDQEYQHKRELHHLSTMVNRQHTP